MSLVELSSVAGLDIRKCWAWVAVFCWVGGHDAWQVCCSFSPGILSESTFLIPCFIFFVWISLVLFQSLIVVCSRKEQGEKQVYAILPELDLSFFFTINILVWLQTQASASASTISATLVCPWMWAFVSNSSSVLILVYFQS